MWIQHGCVIRHDLFLHCRLRSKWVRNSCIRLHNRNIRYLYIYIIASRFRSISTNVLVTIWAAAMLVFYQWAHLLRSWRILMVAGIGLPLLFGAFATYLFFVESPRWLNSRGKYDECRYIFQQNSC